MCLVLGLVIIYVISPIDLLPEIVLGPIGLIDDAIAIVIGMLAVMGGGFMGISNIFGQAKSLRTSFKKK